MSQTICIVSPFAYGAMTGDTKFHIGGVETQTALLAKWLAANTRHKVSIVTWNENTPDDEFIDGVQIIKLCRRSDGFPVIRFFHPRWSSLISALKHADADIYYQNCAEYVTGQVSLFCKLNHRKFVYSVASDPDCDPKLPTLRTIREKILYRYGLKNADSIIVQTLYQQEMLKSGFGLDSTPLPMPCVSPNSNFTQAKHLHDGNFRVLWVGRIASVKRAEILMEIARNAKDISFEVVGGLDQERDYYDSILESSKNLPNVVMHGKLNRQQVNELYSTVSVFCNTSLYEGFPNTFLEAWSHGLPVVSTINPDELITQNNIGLNAKTTEDYIQAFYKLKNDYDYWHELSNNSHEYYLKNHAIDNSMKRFLDVFESL
ncbi:MAG: glycosyltransferase family 4 protein [Candidatus Thiodiazotropha sp.]